MIHLEKVDHKNIWEIIKLKPLDSQLDFVAPNSESIMEAYIAVTSENSYAYPFGIYDDETLVGFLMIGYNEGAIEVDAPKSLNDNYTIWRFMIDKNYQKRGYGKESLMLALEFIKTWPKGKADYVVLSYEPENEVARKLYASLGFKETGEMDDDEIIAVLKLQ